MWSQPDYVPHFNSYFSTIILCSVIQFLYFTLNFHQPVAFVLARDVAHNVGLGVPELGLCKGLTELLRAFNREFGAVEVLTDRAVGPRRPAKKPCK